MKSKSLQIQDYQDIRNDVRSLMRMEATYRGKGMAFDLAHLHRYWEYGSALKALEESGLAGPATILDVGCGHGPLGPYLATEGYDVMEIDPSPNVRSRENLASCMSALKWRFLPIPLSEMGEEKFDAVLSISVVEHIKPDDQPAVWEKFSQIVRPGGLLFLTCDYGEEDAANAAAREMIFTEAKLRSLVQTLRGLDFEIDDVDTEFHGAQVFDYTFFRVIARKKA